MPSDNVTPTTNSPMTLAPLAVVPEDDESTPVTEASVQRSSAHREPSRNVKRSGETKAEQKARRAAAVNRDHVSVSQKAFAIAIYFAINLTNEEVFQVLSRRGFKWIVTALLTQQLLFWPLLLCTCALVSKFDIAFLSNFSMKEFKLSKVSLAWRSGVLQAVCIFLGRLLAFWVGSGRLDVCRALLLPFTAVVVFFHSGHAPKRLCWLGMIVTTIGFITVAPTLPIEVIIAGVTIGIVGAYQGYFYVQSLAAVGGNSVVLTAYHSIYAIVLFAAYALGTREWATGTIDKMTGIEYSGMMPWFKDHTYLIPPYCLFLILGGFLLSISQTYLLSRLTVVSYTIVGQAKGVLASIVGFAIAGIVPNPQTVTGIIFKVLGGAIYAYGNLRNKR